MKIYENEKDMPIGEIEKEDETVHHLVCHGSKRHVLHWDANGEHCSEPRCEVNHRQVKNIGVVGVVGHGNNNFMAELLRKYSRNK